MTEHGGRMEFVRQPGGGWYLWRGADGRIYAERVRAGTHDRACDAWAATGR